MERGSRCLGEGRVSAEGHLWSHRCAYGCVLGPCPSSLQAAEHLGAREGLEGMTAMMAGTGPVYQLRGQFGVPMASAAGVTRGRGGTRRTSTIEWMIST